MLKNFKKHFNTFQEMKKTELSKTEEIIKVYKKYSDEKLNLIKIEAETEIEISKMVGVLIASMIGTITIALTLIRNFVNIEFNNEATSIATIAFTLLLFILFFYFFFHFFFPHVLKIISNSTKEIKLVDHELKLRKERLEKLNAKYSKKK